MDGDQETIVAPSSSITAKKKQNSSIRSIFMHADTVDLFLMVLGVFGSLDDGLTTPFILFISSHLMNSVGSSSTVGPTCFTHSINKNAVNKLYLAAGSFFACFLDEYLKAVSRQEVAYFDLHVTSTSEVNTSVSNDNLVIQDAISEKAPYECVYVHRKLHSSTILS